MKKILSIALLAGVLISSCKDDDDPVPPATTANFQPTTAGSTWTYEFKNTTTPSQNHNFTLTATSKDTTVGTKTYKVFTRTDGENEYYYASGADYYQFGGIAGITDRTELLYFKSNVEAPNGWDETKSVVIPGLGTASVKMSYTIVEKLASFSVEGKSYANVVHVKVDLSNISVSGFPVPVASQDLHFYYADGVGRIKSQIKINIPAAGLNSDNETSLKAYTIVP